MSNDITYNIIDTYDEGYFIGNRQSIRTYVFVSGKTKEKEKEFWWFYFMLTPTKWEDQTFYLKNLDFGVGKTQPYSIQIAKIPKPNSKGKTWFYIIHFLTNKCLFQFVTRWEALSLHHVLTKYSPFKAGKDNNCWVKTTNITGNCNWYTTWKAFLHIIPYRQSGFIFFSGTSYVISFPFDYTDDPETVASKIFLSKSLNVDTINKNDIPANGEIYMFTVKYTFELNTQCAYSGQNIVIEDQKIWYIFERNTKNRKSTAAPSLFKYKFYDEKFAMWLTFTTISPCFWLSKNKLFKIIYNPRFALYNHPELKENVSLSLNNTIFDYSPEKIYYNYRNEILNLKGSWHDEFKQNTGLDETCEICSKPAKSKCSKCWLRFYCCTEHYKYDYITFHFFECQFTQFFSRGQGFFKKEGKTWTEKWIPFYNALIITIQKCMNFIFKRIYSNNDYHFYLQFIVTMVDIMDNFGFWQLLQEFIQYFYKKKEAVSDVVRSILLFYQECIFFYFQMNLLKCTFAVKANLHNLADCYVKIIKNVIAPKITLKDGHKLFTLQSNLGISYKSVNAYILEIVDRPLFFDLDDLFKSSSTLDILELYISRHWIALSYWIKLKIKIGSQVDLRDVFADILVLFEEHYYKKKKTIVNYCYFLISYFWVEIGKIPNTISWLQSITRGFNSTTGAKLQALTTYNLGVLQYVVCDFKKGIHNLEISYKIIKENNFSSKWLVQVLDTWALAYWNWRSWFKAYTLIQTSIEERKKIQTEQSDLKCIKWNAYLNYIIDLYEYSFITRARMLLKNSNHSSVDPHALIKFVWSEEDKESVSSEQNWEQFISVVHFFFKLPREALEQLQIDNPSRASIQNKDEIHHEIQLNLDNSSVSILNIPKENTNEKKENYEYDKDIEIKPRIFDSWPRNKQNEFKELNSDFWKREIIWRDQLGIIEPFNINYHPIYSEEFKKIINKLKSNFLLKEIFYCFQTEKWRDQLYNYNTNNIWFGLSKYLKLEKIKKMIKEESTKIIDREKYAKCKLNAHYNYHAKNRFAKTNHLHINNSS